MDGAAHNHGKKAAGVKEYDVSQGQDLHSSCPVGGFFFALKNLPKGIFPISLFGLFLGLSTTMVYSQLSLFLKNELGASTSDILQLDGVVEFISFLTRIFSGPISDFLGERKVILYVGCFITLFARSFIAVVGSWWSVLIVQSAERLGNGVQATPRDALIADITPSNFHGRSYGFSRSLKTIGSFFGTLVAVQIMLFTSNNYRIVFGCAVIPVIISIFCLSKVKSPAELNLVTVKTAKSENPFKRKYLKSLDVHFWKLMLLALVFELGHFSEHTFPIYANNFLSTSWAGSVSSLVSAGQVLMSFPIGFLADKYGRGKLLGVCMVIMMMANISFMAAMYVNFCPVLFVYLGAFLWGGQMTAIQGLFLSLISERVNEHLRATAIGIYFFILGAAYFIASAIAGKIWTTVGSNFAFLYSLMFSFLALSLRKLLLPKNADTVQ
ncbi:MAG: MFS transporter [Holosporaceae bacterium]|jgi:MFS family permease|nr:MFS transporter [Holosporaceae bacterium]